MKRRFISILLTLCMALAILIMFPMTASARCPMDVLIGTNEPWGMTRTFVVGDAFDGIGEIYEHKKSGIISHTKNREWWANGVQIKQGDVFKQVGMYEMVMRSGDIVATPYKFDVLPRLDHGWQNVSELALITPPKTTYRQGADPFDPRDIVVRVTFRNGQTQDLGHEDLMIFAGARGMRSYEDGVRVLQGFRFFEAGEKDFIVRVIGKELTIPFTVTPFVAAVELTQEPLKGGNRTDTTVRSSDFEVRATFTDGSSQLINGDCLRILGNGSRLFFGGEYDFGASSVTVNITMGDFSIRRMLHTVAGLNILSFPKKTAYSVGDGFDNGGFNAVINDGGKDINVNDRIAFYMDNVQLTQGRAFTAAGKNRVVEVRYAGRKVAEYTIHVYNGAVPVQAAPVPAPVKSPAVAVTMPEVKVLNNKEHGGAPYRDKPDGNVLGTIPQGTKVLLLEKRRDGYAWVRWNGMEYYVWAERIEIPDPAPTAASSTSPNANAAVLESGDYYMKIGDRYIYPAGGYHYWLELSSDKPEKPFRVKLVNNSADRGPEYTITYDGRYVYMDTNCPASMQLHSNNVPHSWRINTYSKFSTIRDYKNQALLVNTFGGAVFVSSISGSAPELGKIVFTKPESPSAATTPMPAPTPTPTPQLPAPSSTTAVPTNTKFMLDGVEVALPAYSIGGNNFVKLRDVAALLGSRFDVRWEDGKAKLYNHAAYTKASGELVAIGKDSKIAALSTTDFVWGDTGVAVTGLTAYTIGGNNYIKLRDIAKLFEFDVDWRDGKAWIEPDVSPYTED